MRISVDVNGTPALVCSPADEDSLEALLRLVAVRLDPKPTITTRPANQKEEEAFITALSDHLRAGGATDPLFAVTL